MIKIKADNDTYVFEENILDIELLEEIKELTKFYNIVKISSPLPLHHRVALLKEFFEEV